MVEAVLGKRGELLILCLAGVSTVKIAEPDQQPSKEEDT